MMRRAFYEGFDCSGDVQLANGDAACPKLAVFCTSASLASMAATACRNVGRVRASCAMHAFASACAHIQMHT